MGVRPIPVLVVSGHTDAAADLTLTALETGAVDVHPEAGRAARRDRPLHRRHRGRADARRAEQPRAPAPCIAASGLAAASTLRRRRLAARAPGRPASTPTAIVCIGASTGGVPAVCKVVAGLRQRRRADRRGPAHAADLHRPPRRAAGADHGPALPPRREDGRAPRARHASGSPPAGRHLRVSCKAGGYVAGLSDEIPVSGHKPSIDVLFHSAAQARPVRKATGVILTGMGRDGADGLLAMREAGAHTIAPGRGSCDGLRHAEGRRRRSAPLARSCRSTASRTACSPPSRPSGAPRPRRARRPSRSRSLPWLI